VAIIAVLTLMALRRAFAALGPTGAARPVSLCVVQEGVGLAISILAVMAAIAVQRTWRATPNVPPTIPAPGPTAASARAEERQLLCYDLHDGLAQLVIGARMHLDAFCSLRGAGADRAERELSLTARRLNEATQEVTRLVSYLTSVVLCETPLSDAVKTHLGELAESEGWQYEFDDGLGQERLDPAVESMTYRVIQEALNNAAKHAATKRVRVSLTFEEGAVAAVVQDWGRGFDVDEARSSSGRLGLRGMSNRARLLGGSCTIRSRPGEGTLVVMRVPCQGGTGRPHGDRLDTLAH
jgi:signal transduction histidine kinase